MSVRFSNRSKSDWWAAAVLATFYHSLGNCRQWYEWQRLAVRITFCSSYDCDLISPLTSGGFTKLITTYISSVPPLILVVKQRAQHVWGLGLFGPSWQIAPPHCVLIYAWVCDESPAWVCACLSLAVTFCVSHIWMRLACLWCVHTFTRCEHCTAVFFYVCARRRVK